jgi:surface protein
MPQPIKAYLGQVPLFDTGQSSAGYQRPSDWLPLPSAEPQSVKILNAVFDQSENYAMLRMILNPSSSTYQVDWGDGVVENIANNVNAFHNYDFNNPVLNGTLCSRGYKQAIITIKPNSGTCTFFTLNLRATSPAGLQPYSTGVLDINVNLPSLIGGTRLQIGGNSVRHNLLERVNISSWGELTILDNLFFNCFRLQSVNETEWNTSEITGIANIFRSCGALKSLDCSNWNISKITNWSSAFLACYGLVSFKSPSGTIPVGGNFINLFGSCNSLEELDLSGLNVSNVTNMNSTFSNCLSLRKINLTGWNTSAVTNASNLFSFCNTLQEIPDLNLSGVTTITSAAFCVSANSLTRMRATGINVSVNISQCMLGANSLNEVYSNLSANGTGKTITVTGNYGTASDDPSIATAKGWTVTG